MIYLASPYSDPDEEVMHNRWIQICTVASRLMREGKHIFSPIAHTHGIAHFGGLPRGWDFWEQYDRFFIGHCQMVLVVRLPGWDKSKGIAAEIAIAKDIGVPVEYMDP